MQSLVQQVLSQETTDGYAQEWLAETLDAVYRHKRQFGAIAKNFPDCTRVEQHFSDVVKCALQDGIVNCNRLVVVFAFATYLQEVFGIDLKKATSSLVEEAVYGHVRHHPSSELEQLPSGYRHLYDWPIQGALDLLDAIVYYNENNCTCGVDVCDCGCTAV